MANLPVLATIVKTCDCTSSRLMHLYRYGMLVLTFFCYMSYHISRKPLSIVKAELHRNCSGLTPKYAKLFLSLHYSSQELQSLVKGNNNDTWCDFPPFNHDNYKLLFGELDYAFLFTYAIGMFFSGIIAERVSIRYFICSGMVLSGIFTAMFGVGDFANIHFFSFYVIAQVMNGLFQTTGWPAVVTVVGNWFGKQRRGLIMGIWNSHTSFGNILGSVIASAFVATSWGLSFVIPGIIIAAFGIISFFTLVEKPEDFGVAYQPLAYDERDAAIGGRDDYEHSGSSRSSYNSVRGQTLGDDPFNNNTNSKIASSDNQRAIGFIGALKIPGVIEYSLCLLFAKLVSYTFLFWLPFYIKNTSTLSAENSGFLSTLFDVGGIFGGILAGFASDKAGGRASTCGVMLIIGAAMMYLFNVYGTKSLALSVVLLLITGGFVNGPYALITTAVSADLGTHPVLMGNAKALSTVTAIIDGTGSIGAALGPLFTGLIVPHGWQNVFWMLIASNITALFLLTRLILKEFLSHYCSTERPREAEESDLLASNYA